MSEASFAETSSEDESESKGKESSDRLKQESPESENQAKPECTEEAGKGNEPEEPGQSETKVETSGGTSGKAEDTPELATEQTESQKGAEKPPPSKVGNPESVEAPDQRPKRAKPSEAESVDDRPARRGFRILGVEFAPLNTPMRRRLQTLAVLQWLLSIAVLPVLCVLLLLILLFTPLAPLVLAYMGWVLIFDRSTSQRGGRRWDRIRRWSLWKHYRDYFPIRLVKSAELDPAHNYLIGYHPHGIISCGAFCNFGTEATGFSAKFPGIRPHLLTLRVNFFWPLLRAYYLAAGLCDVSRPSIQYILGREGGGNAAIIVVGGAQEALDARPGNYRLTLLRRKGFARMALQTGAHLVPCFSFGENDLFKQASNPPGSRVRAFQQLFKGKMGSSPPLFYGRGVFNYTFGLLPYRHEVITVVGPPIPVTKCIEPTSEQVDTLHNEYMAKLSDLFDLHKGRYGVSDDVKLEFV